MYFVGKEMGNYGGCACSWDLADMDVLLEEKWLILREVRVPGTVTLKRGFVSHNLLNESLT